MYLAKMFLVWLERFGQIKSGLATVLSKDDAKASYSEPPLADTYARRTPVK
jgi:hypothetical protein